MQTRKHTENSKPVKAGLQEKPQGEIWTSYIWKKLSVLCDDLTLREAQQEGDTFTLIDDSRCWTAKLTQYCNAIILQLKRKKKLLQKFLPKQSDRVLQIEFWMGEFAQHYILGT